VVKDKHVVVCRQDVVHQWMVGIFISMAICGHHHMIAVWTGKLELVVMKMRVLVVVMVVVVKVQVIVIVTKLMVALEMVVMNIIVMSLMVPVLVVPQVVHGTMELIVVVEDYKEVVI